MVKGHSRSEKSTCDLNHTCAVFFLTVYHHMGSTILITRVTCARTRDSRPTLECL